MNTRTPTTRRRVLRPLTLGSALIGLFSVAIIAAVVVPLVRMILSVFVVDGSLNLGAFGQVFTAPWLPQTLLNTAIVVLAGGAIAVAAAALFAWLNERTDARIAWLSDTFPIIPLLVPAIASAIGWVMLLSPGAGELNVIMRALVGSKEQAGPLDIFTWPGLILLYALELFPYAFLTISAALRNLDSTVEEASRMSGVSPFRTFIGVTLPAIRPALGAASMLVLVMGMALFSVPEIIGVTARIDVLSVRIINLEKNEFPPQTGQAIVLSLIILVVVGVGWFWQNRLLRAGRYSTSGGKGAKTTPVRLGPWRYLARSFFVLYALLAVVLPFLALLFVSFQRFWQPKIVLSNFGFDAYVRLFSNPMVTTSLVNSLILATVGATIGTAISLAISTFLRRRPGPLTVAADAVAKLPSAMSHIVVAIAILVTFGSPPFSLVGTLTILIIGYVIVYLPQGTISTAATVNSVGSEMHEASTMSGAGEFRTLRRVSLPLMTPGIVSVWSVLFALMVGDLTTSVLLSGTTTTTIGVTILDQYTNGSYPLIAALSLVVTAVSSVIVIGGFTFARRRQHRQVRVRPSAAIHR